MDELKKIVESLTGMTIDKNTDWDELNERLTEEGPNLVLDVINLLNP